MQREVQLDYQALLERSPNPYMALDAGLHYIWANEAYLKMTMRSLADLQGRHVFDAFPSDENSESYRLLLASLRRTLETGQPDEIALIRYDIANADGTMDERYWSATHTPFLGPTGEVDYLLQHTVDVTELHRLRRLKDEMNVIGRAKAVQEKNRSLAEESEQLRNLLQQAPGMVTVVGGPRHEFMMANTAYREMVGNPDLIGRPVADVLPELVDQGFIALLDKVMDTGVPYVGHREKVVLRDPDSGEEQERYFNFVFQPITDDSDTISGILVQGHEVTDEVKAQDRQQLLINELNHRVKNTLAIVQGLASQSFSEVDGAAPSLENFHARLSALSAAHSLLTDCNWKSASLRKLIEGSIEATAGNDAGRIVLNGPEVELAPQAAVTLAMVVHELSTNAIKYGALSADGGRVEVTWRIEEDDEAEGQRFSLSWSEIDGPPVSPPTRRGFGSRLIERGMAGEAGGRANVDYRPEGLVCHLSALL